jgi:hypothetical protein
MKTMSLIGSAIIAAGLWLTPASAAAQQQSSMGPGDLRTALNATLAEHVYLAAAATGAALGGRQAEFGAAGGALDANSIGLSQAIGMVYGRDAETAFLALWRRHIGFVVDYTTGVAIRDRAKQDQAVTALLAYADDFGAFLSGANPNLPKSVVADLVRTHIVTLKAVIDAQAAGDQPTAYARVREAAAHMKMIGDPLAAAIVKQFPQRFASR